jgi:hypothetical protein
LDGSSASWIGVEERDAGGVVMTWKGLSWTETRRGWTGLIAVELGEVSTWIDGVG